MSSGFITETELAEIRKKRQEEWEKVRRPDQPLELPEEPIDSRSLYERLKEQKMKKDLEYEEAHKLKNLIRGLDDDEVQFLDLVDRTKMNAEKQQQIEEQKEIEEFRQRVALLQEEAGNKSQLPSKMKSPNHTLTRPSQKSILSGIVRKRKNGELVDDDTINSVKKPKQVNENNEITQEQEEKQEQQEHQDKKQQQQKQNHEKSNDHEVSFIMKNDTDSLNKGALKCIGILPGIGKYRESSDSEISSSSEEDTDFPYGKFDLVGRTFQIRRKCKGDDDD